MHPQESVALEAAKQAGRILLDHWGRRKDPALKSNPIDLVTEADRASERAILAVVREACPDHAILAEESGARVGSGGEWIIDPLDGTTNFAHGYPQFCVSIAFRRDGRTELGVILDPLREETFLARLGGGAWLGQQRIGVSETPALETSLVATGFPYDRREHADFYLAYLKAFMMRTHGIRRAGAAALDLCAVAAGRVDGFWEWRLQAWDVAAGALLVEEAGGRVTRFDGSAWGPFDDQILATNGRIHDEAATVLRALGTTPPRNA